MHDRHEKYFFHVQPIDDAGDQNKFPTVHTSLVHTVISVNYRLLDTSVLSA